MLPQDTTDPFLAMLFSPAHTEPTKPGTMGGGSLETEAALGLSKHSSGLAATLTATRL